MNGPVRIYLVLGADGTVEDVSVLTRDQKARLAGFHLIEDLSEEIQVFEARVKYRLDQLRRAQ